MTASAPHIALWLVASAIAMFMAMGYETAALVDGSYIPAGNDSFYHARRIIDAAVGDRGFYEFDDMIHVPEGSWLNWPWAYDYLLARALSVALAIAPGTAPMAFLAHVPVAWLVVNTGLLVLICRKAGLSVPFTAAVMLGFALLPLTQSLHGTGVIDHHFIELTFVLAAVLTGLGFFSPEAERRDAMLFGVVLGLAPAFHNGLFILQFPLLLAAGLTWLLAKSPPASLLKLLAASLCAASLVATLPSGPLYDLQFEFWTLSWFHLYIAACSAVCLLYFATRTYSPANLGMFSIAAIVMVIPIIAKLILGTAFLSGGLILLEHVAEVKSPLARLSAPNGMLWVSSFYSWLFFAIPPLVVYFAWRAWQTRDPAQLYLSAFAIFGFVLLLTQFRLHPFGSWAMLAGSALMLQDGIARTRLPQLAGLAIGLAVVAVAIQPAMKYRALQEQPPGLTRDYAIVRPLFPSLAEACGEKSGAVLSYNDDGHYVRYHTDCSVMTNNFLMTPLHERKIKEADRLLQMTPQQFLAANPGIDYLFVRMYGFYQTGPNGVQAVPQAAVRAQNAPLFAALTFDEAVPREFELIDELRVADDWDFAYASVYRIRREQSSGSR